MKLLMETLYDDLDKAVAFELRFTNMIYVYGDMCYYDFAEETCHRCEKSVRTKPFMAPKSSCKKPYGELVYGGHGVNRELRDELIARFDITEEDFAPMYDKRGNVVYYEITPRHTMKPIFRENHWTPNPPCKACGSQQYSFQGFENEKEEIYHLINPEALADLHDLNVTFERFSTHEPKIVVSRRVYDFLTEKYPRTHYYPFYLTEE